MKFSGVTILQGVEFSIFPIDFEWALQQCSATALPVIFCGWKRDFPLPLWQIIKFLDNNTIQISTSTIRKRFCRSKWQVGVSCHKRAEPVSSYSVCGWYLPNRSATPTVQANSYAVRRMSSRVGNPTCCNRLIRDTNERSCSCVNIVSGPVLRLSTVPRRT